MDENRIYESLRHAMVKQHIENRGIDDPKVLGAMRKVPRHLFVSQGFRDIAYEDYPLPIGEEQTISQPFIIAKMTQALELKPGDSVLEIGAGSGYQAAILSEIVSRVYTVERIESLLLKTQKLLKNLGYNNITTKLCDGTTGWPDKSLFDAIIVTAAAPQIPEDLLSQLSENGRMVIPVGGVSVQDLLQIQKHGTDIKATNLCGCRFVKLIGKYGWK